MDEPGLLEAVEIALVIRQEHRQKAEAEAMSRRR